MICLYNAEHDWARIEGDEAGARHHLYAADSLGEVVHYEPPLAVRRSEEVPPTARSSR
jgi:hypothetical protein